MIFFLIAGTAAAGRRQRLAGKPPGPGLRGEDGGMAGFRRRWPPAPGRCSRPAAGRTIRVGVLSLYRAQPGPLPPQKLADAAVFADIALQLLLDSA